MYDNYLAASDEIFIPLDGPPIVNEPTHTSPAEAYNTLPAVTPYNPYLYENRSNKYFGSKIIAPYGGELSGNRRPYYSSFSMNGREQNPANWNRSAPNLKTDFPRAWI